MAHSPLFKVRMAQAQVPKVQQGFRPASLSASSPARPRSLHSRRLRHLPPQLHKLQIPLRELVDATEEGVIVGRRGTALTLEEGALSGGERGGLGKRACGDFRGAEAKRCGDGDRASKGGCWCGGERVPDGRRWESRGKGGDVLQREQG